MTMAESLPYFTVSKKTVPTFKARVEAAPYYTVTIKTRTPPKKIKRVPMTATERSRLSRQRKRERKRQLLNCASTIDLPLNSQKPEPEFSREIIFSEKCLPMAERAQEYQVITKTISPPLRHTKKAMTAAERMRLWRQRKREKERLMSDCNNEIPKSEILKPLPWNEENRERPSIENDTQENNTQFEIFEPTGDSDEESQVEERNPSETIVHDTSRDEYSVYGEYIANTLRNCPRNNEEIFIAQHDIHNIIYNLYMGTYTNRTSSVSPQTNITNDGLDSSQPPAQLVIKKEEVILD